MSRSIKEIGEDLKAVKETLSREIESIPMGHRGGWACALVQANERLPILTKEIQNMVVPWRLVALFAFGDSKAISRTSEFLKQNEGVVVDASSLYTKIAERIEPSFDRHRWWGTVQYDIMCQELFKKASQLGYLFVDKAPAISEGACNTFEEVVDKVRQDIRNSGLGDPVMRQILTEEIVAQVIERGIEADQIPVIVTGVGSTAEKAALSTLFGVTFQRNFSSNFKVNKNNVLSLFNTEEKEPKGAEEDPKAKE